MSKQIKAPAGTTLATYEDQETQMEIVQTKGGQEHRPASPLLRGMRPGALKPIEYDIEEDDGKPSLQMANFSGDITVTWEPSQHEVMKKLIEQKMAQGYKFFIVKKRGKVAKALLGSKKVEMKESKDLDGAEALQVPTGAVSAFVAALDDKDVAQAILNGTAQLSRGTKRDPAAQLEPCKDAEKVARSKAVGFRPVTGG